MEIPLIIVAPRAFRRASNDYDYFDPFDEYAPEEYSDAGLLTFGQYTALLEMGLLQ